MSPRPTGPRHAAILFAVCGLLGLVAIPAPGARTSALLAVAAADLAMALTVLVIPWHRLPQRATLLIAVPAFGIIVASNAEGLLPPRSLAMMFVLVFVWIGSHHRPWQSLWLLPVAGPAFALAVHVQPHGLPADPRAYVLLGVVCVLVAETVARSQRRLKASETELRFLADHSTDLVTRVGYDGLIRYASPSIEHLLGWRPEQVVGSEAAAYRHPDDAVPGELAKANPGEAVTVVRRLRRADGGYTWLESVSQAVVGPDGRPEVLSFGRDITARREMEARLAHVASHDALTGLANRVQLDERLAGSLDADGALAVLFVDLDGFKGVNDLYGHLVGDRVLKRVARRLEQITREDDLVARYGGDEFVVVAEGLPETMDVSQLARRVERELSKPYRIGNVTAVIGASVGVTVAEPGMTVDELVSEADRSMYAVMAARRAVIPSPRTHVELPR
jgi:diguanylate cyclase (GGDEF)-like protein/PAS domain S-box-containing protein